MLLDGGDECGNFPHFSLGFELHSTIGEIAHVTSNFESFGDLQGLKSKTHALHVTGKEDGFVMHVGHRRDDTNTARQRQIETGSYEEF